jgi:hypothetical protein
MSWARADAWALRGAATLVALFCAAGLYRIVAVLFLHVALDPNEGWNAYHAAAAMSGMPLYPDANALFFNNYPPLSFYLVGALGKLSGDNIIAGRVVSLLAFASAGILVVSIAQRQRVGVLPSVLGVLFFASVLLLFSDYVGMNDPQLLGHALQLAGLFLLLGEHRSKQTTVLAALLLTGALFVKHNLVALPVATIAWLSTKDRADAMMLAGTCIVLAAIGLIWFRIAVGSGLFAHLASARVWSIANMRDGIAAALAWATVPLAGILYLLNSEGSDRPVAFCAIYAGLSLLVGAIASGGTGVDANAFFDLAIALSLSVALAFGRLGARRWPVAPLAALAFLPIAFSLHAALDEDWYMRDFWFHPWADEVRTAESDIALLRAQKGDALCETLALCYWAGKPEGVDVFNLGQAYATGAHSDRALVDRISHHAFAVIEYESVRPFQLTPDVLAATVHAYELKRSSDNGTFFVPRP